MSRKVRSEEQEFFSIRFIQKLNEWKEKTNGSQADLISLLHRDEDETELSPNTITSWKKGVNGSYPSDKYLKRICELFNVTEDYFNPYSKDHPFYIHSYTENGDPIYMQYSYSDMIESEGFYTEKDEKLKKYCLSHQIDIAYVRRITSNPDLSRFLPIGLYKPGILQKGNQKKTNSPFQIEDSFGNRLYLTEQDLNFIGEMEQEVKAFEEHLLRNKFEDRLTRFINTRAYAIQEQTNLTAAQIIKACPSFRIMLNRDLTVSIETLGLMIINEALRQFPNNNKIYQLTDSFQLVTEVINNGRN